MNVNDIFIWHQYDHYPVQNGDQPGDGWTVACIQLFGERLSEKVHATIPKGIVGGFELTVFQRSLKEWHERPWTYVFAGYGTEHRGVAETFHCLHIVFLVGIVHFLVNLLVFRYWVYSFYRNWNTTQSYSGSVIVPLVDSCKITVSVWGKVALLKFVGNTK